MGLRPDGLGRAGPDMTHIMSAVYGRVWSQPAWLWFGPLNLWSRVNGQRMTKLQHHNQTQGWNIDAITIKYPKKVEKNFVDKKTEKAILE